MPINVEYILVVCIDNLVAKVGCVRAALEQVARDRGCLKGPANRALRAQTAIVINTCNYRLSRIRLL